MVELLKTLFSALSSILEYTADALNEVVLVLQGDLSFGDASRAHVLLLVVFLFAALLSIRGMQHRKMMGRASGRYSSYEEVARRTVFSHSSKAAPPRQRKRAESEAKKPAPPVQTDSADDAPPPAPEPRLQDAARREAPPTPSVAPAPQSGDTAEYAAIDTGGGEVLKESEAAVDAPAQTVQFSAFCPRDAEATKRYSLLVYAHLAAALAAVERDALKFEDELGPDGVPAPKTARQSTPIKPGTPITIVPTCDDVTFSPPRLEKAWEPDWTRFNFDFRPGAAVAGETLFVIVSVQVAQIEIARIKLAVDVAPAPRLGLNVRAAGVSGIVPDAAAGGDTLTTANPLAAAKHQLKGITSEMYQQIFVSYSRQDSAVTEAYRFAQRALGNDVFIDVDSLRTGENWQAALAQAIDQSDVFQLFWSAHSAVSEYCRYEWDYALRKRGSESRGVGFIRPVYWRKPMPDPPPELQHLHFQYVAFAPPAPAS